MKARNYRPIYSTMTAKVQIISASWCKRCQTIKPDVAEQCRIGGADLSILDYEEMDEDEKAHIKSLPTIRMRLHSDTEWKSFTADSLDQFKSALFASAIATTDF